MSVLSDQRKCSQADTACFSFHTFFKCSISPGKNLCIGKNRHRRASFTVEAALVFPVFFFSVFMMWQLFLLLLYQMQVGNSVREQVIKYSFLGYTEVQEDGGSPDVSWIYQPVLWNALPENDRVTQDSVLCFTKEDGWIEVRIGYKFLMESPLFPEIPIRIVQRFLFYPYIGENDPDKFAEEDTDTEKDIVYVTEYGTVYHESKACGYLTVTVKAVEFSAVEEARNNSGRKYKECERCDHLELKQVVYISDGGTKYHRSAKCSSLKRTIREIGREETGTLPACHKCGEKGEED